MSFGADLSNHSGVVLAVDGAYAVVLRERFDPCILCPGEDECTEKEQHDCGIEIRALNEIGAQVGDTVALALTDDDQILRAVLYVYGVPMTFLLAGLVGGVVAAAAGGLAPTLQGGVGVLGLLAGLGLSVPFSRRLNRKAFESGRFTPVVREVEERSGLPTCGAAFGAGSEGEGCGPIEV